MCNPAWPASRRARPARSTTGARCRSARLHLEEQLAGTSCRPNDAPSSLRPKASRGRAAGASRRAGARGDARRAGAKSPFNRPRSARRVPPWSAAHAYTNLYGPKTARPPRPSSATSTHRVGIDERHAPHRARLRHDAFPGARGPVDRHRAAGHRRAGPAALSRASTRSRARATASGPGYNNLSLTVKRVHRGPPGQAGARRRLATTLRPEGRRHGAGHRPVRQHRS